MADISLRIGAKDDGAAAILRAVAEALKQLGNAAKANTNISVQERTEAEKIADAQRKSEAAIRGHTRSLRDQMAAMRELAAEQRVSNQAARENVRAMQQATQAAIQSAAQQRAVIAEQAAALQQQTQAQQRATNAQVQAAAKRTQAALQANASETKATHAQTQAIINDATAQARARAQATQSQIAAARDANKQQADATRAAISGAAQQARAIQQGTQAALAGTRATTAAMQQQTQATNRATAAALRLASAQIAASNQAAAAARAQSAVQVAQINAQSRQQVALINAQSRATAGMRQQSVAFKDHSFQTHNSATAMALLIRRISQLAIFVTGARQIAAFIKAGFDFNETINQATLGIASLITAQAKLLDSQGRLIEGSKALDAAIALSTEQVTQLRIAGIQTAATTEQLVTAFQQAVGPGLRSGLDLDQIRKFTVGVTQAATAIGLPMHQLNEEVRSLLAGTITYNTRIAKTLGISNELISSWKQQGVFAERLLAKFTQFNLAGERSMQNMTVLLSNLKEALDVFAGTATKPLFDNLRKSGVSALNQFFDFDRGQISAKFAGIVNVARDVFASIGNIVVKAIMGAIDIVTKLSKYFDDNRDAVDGIIDAAQGLGKVMFSIVAIVAKAIVGLIDWGVRTGAIETLMRTVAGITKLVADLLGFIVNTFGSPEFKSGAENLTKFLKFTPVGLGFTVITAGLGLLVDALSDVNIEQERAQRNVEIANEADRNRAVEISRLADEYTRLQKKIDSGKLSSAALAETKGKLSKTINQLIQFAPQYSDALKKWETDTKGTTKAVNDLVDAQVKLLRAQFDVAKARELQIQNQIGLERDLAIFDEINADKLRVVGKDKEADEAEKRAKTARENLARLQVQLAAAKAATADVINAVASLAGTEGPHTARAAEIKPETEGAKEKRSNDFRQQIEAAIEQVKEAFKRAKDALDTELDHQEISFKDYVTHLLNAERDAVNSEIVLRRQLLAKTQDVGERAKIQQDINDLVNKRIGLGQDAKTKLTDMEKALNDEMQQLALARLRQEEKNGDARVIELEQQYQKLRRVMVVNSKDTTGLDAFINVEVARSRLEDMNRIISRATSQAQQQIDEINQLAVRGMVSTAEQAQAIGAAYDSEISAIRRALPVMRELAEQSKNEDAINGVRQLEVELGKLVEAQRLATSSIVRYTETALGGLQSGLTEAFTGIGTTIEETTKHFDEATGKMVEETKKRLFSLKDFAKQVSLSILQALQQQLAAEFAQDVTNAARGALSKIGINLGGDMSSAVLQQTAAKEQVTAATTNVSAATQFAAAIAALGQMVPGLLAGSVGGTAASAAAGTAAGPIGAAAASGAAETATLTAATALQAAASALLGASASLSGSLVPSAAALSGAAAALSAAAAALSGAGGLAAAGSTTSKILNFAGGLSGRGNETGVVRSFPGAISGPRRSRLTTTTDRVVVLPSFGVPEIASPRVASVGAGSAATVRAVQARQSGAGGLTPSQVQIKLQSTSDHVLGVMKSDDGVSVQVDNMRRRRRSMRGAIE